VLYLKVRVLSLDRGVNVCKVLLQLRQRNWLDTALALEEKHLVRGRIIAAAAAFALVLLLLLLNHAERLVKHLR